MEITLAGTPFHVLPNVEGTWEEKINGVTNWVRGWLDSRNNQVATASTQVA